MLVSRPSKAQEDAKKYVSKHDLEKQMSRLMELILQEHPADPKQFILGHLSKHMTAWQLQDANLVRDGEVAPRSREPSEVSDCDDEGASDAVEDRREDRVPGETLETQEGDRKGTGGVCEDATAVADPEGTSADNAGGTRADGSKSGAETPPGAVDEGVPGDRIPAVVAGRHDSRYSVTPDTAAGETTSGTLLQGDDEIAAVGTTSTPATPREEMSAENTTPHADATGESPMKDSSTAAAKVSDVPPKDVTPAAAEARGESYVEDGMSAGYTAATEEILNADTTGRPATVNEESFSENVTSAAEATGDNAT